MASESISPFLVLNKGKERRVLSRLNAELRSCTSFKFYVAFVNSEGVASLKQSLLDAKQRGVNGQVLVSKYLNFSDPNALRSLLKFPNLDVRIAVTGNVHAKGYFFANPSGEHFLIGSSNWTASALSTNTELNVHIKSGYDEKIARQVKEEFDYQFQKALPLSEGWIDKYEQSYRESDLVREKVEDGQQYSPLKISEAEIRPNSMQKEALRELQSLRKAGGEKALLVSATGTGKTFLAAFDAQRVRARHLLFVVHRENIARKAMQSFKKIFGGSKTYSVYSGNEKDSSGDFVFSTVQTLSRTSNLDKFTPDQFDYIVVDESHRAAAKSYSTFLSYFNARFLLGMTATPERTDGKDIFEFFDHNIAYEIRLQRAMEEGMLCPFHYYGISDLTIDNEPVEQVADFNRLIADERVDRIIEQADFYGCYDGVVRGLVFCSRNEEAEGLSDRFNARGFQTVALSAASSEHDREAAIQRLESSNLTTKLDYIFTVDIFNEGVDIPTVNQIIMLRPTQSAIVFVQQLGRGMRKVTNTSKYLTVLDFIGNYQTNYLIPVALYGDSSNDKDQLRRLLVGGNDGIPGTSTVNFDAISRDRVFESINTINLQRKRDLCADYIALKARLGRIPTMMDFLNHGHRDPRAFVKYSKSYYNFVSDQELERVPNLDANLRGVLSALAKDAVNGKTYTEPLLLLNLIEKGTVSLSEIKAMILDSAGYFVSDSNVESAVRSINMRFLREKVDGALISVGEKLNIKLAEYKNGVVTRTAEFEDFIAVPAFKSFLHDATSFALAIFLKDYCPSRFIDGFVRYRKYSRADVFKILGFEVNPVAQNVGGYLKAKDDSSCPIFVTYHKSDSIADTVKYEDHFKNPGCIHYFSKSNRTLKSPDVQFFINSSPAQRLPVFMQKNNDEGISFYYLGEVEPDPESFYEDTMPNENGSSGIPVVRMDLLLDEPVITPLYEYFVS